MLGSLSKAGDDCDSFLDLFAGRDLGDSISYPGDHSGSPAHPARSDFSELPNYDGSSDFVHDSDSEGRSELDVRAVSIVTHVQNKGVLRPLAYNFPFASVDGESLKTAQ
jgi:hypothetical protein